VRTGLKTHPDASICRKYNNRAFFAECSVYCKRTINLSLTFGLVSLSQQLMVLLGTYGPSICIQNELFVVKLVGFSKGDLFIVDCQSF
jgi:hypothetical protein